MRLCWNTVWSILTLTTRKLTTILASTEYLFSRYGVVTAEGYRQFVTILNPNNNSAGIQKTQVLTKKMTSDRAGQAARLFVGFIEDSSPPKALSSRGVCVTERHLSPELPQLSWEKKMESKKNRHVLHIRSTPYTPNR